MEVVCLICQNRLKFKIELDRIGKREGASVREKMRTNLLTNDGRVLREGFVERLAREEVCPKCGSRGAGFATTGANFRMDRHYHECSVCGWKSKVYPGKGISIMLE